MAEFTRTGEYFMAYDENNDEQVISFKHKASDSTFNDGMTLEEKLGTIDSIRICHISEEPSSIPDGQILFIYE